MGCSEVSFNKDLSNHWFKVKYEILFDDTSVYNNDVATLFKLSSKSAIITESKLIPPKVSFFFKFSIFFYLFWTREFCNLIISSLRFCFLCEYLVNFSICAVNKVGSES